MARGTVTRRGGVWNARWSELAEDGRRRHRRRGGFRTRAEAQRFLTEQLQRLSEGSYTAPARTTVGEFLVEWLAAKRGNLRPLTHESYSTIVRNHIAPALGHRRLQGLSGGILTAFYRDLEGKLAPSTRRLVHAVLHGALRDAVRWGYLVRNPADMADPPRAGRSRALAWTAGELARFLEHVADDRLFALWRLAATSGMRRGELLGLTWRALDLDNARLEVSQQLVPTPGGSTFGPPKSARSRRTIALDSETVDALGAHREAQLLERDFAAGAYGDHDLVFADELGGLIRPDGLTEWFRNHRKAAGIPTGSLHILRHTAATLALTSGVPLHIVAARLGDDPKTVLSTYAHLLPSSDEIAAERVAAAVAGGA
jgi:integrase